MSKIILCRGIQGSGKSTYSKKWAEEEPEKRLRYNNDDVRNMLGKYWVPSRESVVRRAKIAIITEAMENGFDIIIDNMNLNPNEVKYYQGIIREFKERRGKEYTLEFKDFKTPLEVCIERDSKRPNPIGREVITMTYNKYKNFYEQETETFDNN